MTSLITKASGGYKPGGLIKGLSGQTAAEGTQAALESQAAAAAIQRQEVEKARQSLLNIFPAAEQNLQSGFQGALDVFGQTGPAQMQAFQQGNVGAQQALIAGLPQMNNALLGNQIDYSAFQPQQQQYDASIFNQQLPQYQTIADALKLNQTPQQPNVGTTPNFGNINMPIKNGWRMP